MAGQKNHKNRIKSRREGALARWKAYKPTEHSDANSKLKYAKSQIEILEALLKTL